MVRIYLENMVPSDVSNAVRKTLADLHERGYKIALGSSSRKAKIILKKVALEDEPEKVRTYSGYTRIRRK